ncbi:hypothetical protein PSCICJ_45520 [Pseudomonas cichorii]|uniref:hypothetical protein n=1 Tax=Pseudomonas cichorii TaxID=36746 RepID=UPI0019107EB4|nr:hypothetical protein [Pseudomonas cichorii]GFM68434.1 hypothetical protein PSCICJ_45520 [Pseudomonas cichorii]
MNNETTNNGIVKVPSDIITLRIPTSDATVSESVTQPYVREANGTAKLSAGVANRGFTIVLPAFNEVIYDEVLFTFSTLNYSAGIISTRLPFTSGEDTIDTVSTEEVNGPFKAGDKARIRVFLRVTPEIWVAGKDSVEYEIV